MRTPFDREAALRAWSEAEHRAALSDADHSVVDTTAAVRATVLDFALQQGQDEELYDACAVLGRLVAEAGGSASLAATAIDRACEALGELAPRWATPARAATVEGYARAVVDGERRTGHASWDFPASAVRIDDVTIAIAAGHPSDDDETLATWAAVAARTAAREGVRRALIAGSPRPRRALVEALAIVGIECIEASPARP